MKEAKIGEIRTLVEVIERGSFAAAAARLGLTPSAVSKQIGRLEAEFGVRLLNRTTRKVRATDAGRSLHETTRPLFDAFDRARETISRDDGRTEGTVRVSATPAFVHARLVPVLSRLAAEHPALTFDVVVSARHLDFLEDGIDLAIREGRLRDSSLRARRIGVTRALLCAAPDYLAARGEPACVEDLAGHDLLQVASTSPIADITRLRGADGRRLKLNARMRINDLYALRDLARDGAGIVGLPDYVAAEALARGELVRVLPDTPTVEIPIHAVYPSRRHLPRRVEVLLDALAAGTATAGA